MQKDKITYSTNIIRGIILHGRNQGFWAIKTLNWKSTISYKKTDKPDYKWQRVTTSDYKRSQVTTSDYKGLRVTTSDYEWLQVRL